MLQAKLLLQTTPFRKFISILVTFRGVERSRVKFSISLSTNYPQKITGCNLVCIAIFKKKKQKKRSREAKERTRNNINLHRFLADGTEQENQL